MNISNGLNHYISNIPISTQPSSNTKISKLLELLNLSDDLELQSRIFSMMTTHLITNTDCNQDIVTCNFMYQKVLVLLTQGQPIKTAKTLYFLSALLYNESEETFTRKKSLVIYAQNMVRSSGCLLAMCNLFISSMMHHQTWRALCRCLADCCQHSYENQSFCSHLVPLSVEKCKQGDMDVVLTLKSLISNHNRNMHLFLECNGMTIFKKEILRNDTCMHLLDLLAQELSPEMLRTLHKTVNHHLQFFKKEYGPDTQVGQWATLILYHMHHRLKGLNAPPNYEDTLRKSELEQSVIQTKKTDFDDTGKLLQNVLREIYQLNTGDMKQNTPFAVRRVMSFQRQLQESAPQKNIWLQNAYSQNHGPQTNNFKTSKAHSNDLSFSFLLRRHMHEPNIHDSNGSMLISPQKPKEPKRNETVAKPLNDTSDPYESFAEKQYASKNHCIFNDTNIDSFKPTFVSTPKHSKLTENKTANSTKISQASRLSRATIKRAHLKSRKLEHRFRKETEKPKQDASKQRSVSSRFLDAINESCTTIVKTVKNIFVAKKSDGRCEQSTMTSDIKADPSCSYSFTEYMRKRDAMLSSDSLKKSAESTFRNNDACKTCNDTAILKRKLESDVCLRKTVRKLKLGINLYGCDFKKISRIMWPRDECMTPEVLYNLYRRVILK